MRLPWSQICRGARPSLLTQRESPTNKGRGSSMFCRDANLKWPYGHIVCLFGHANDFTTVTPVRHVDSALSLAALLRRRQSPLNCPPRTLAASCTPCQSAPGCAPAAGRFFLTTPWLLPTILVHAGRAVRHEEARVAAPRCGCPRIPFSAQHSLSGSVGGSAFVGGVPGGTADP